MSSNAEAKAPAAPAKQIPVPVNLAISGLAGMMAWCIAHPFDLIKMRMMLSEPGTPFSTVFNDTRKVGLWKGLSGGLTRQVVYTSCRLGFYDPMKNFIVRDQNNVTLLERAAAGAAAGATAAFLSSPVEVCLVLQAKASEKLSVIGAARNVLSQSGVGGFWRGGVPLCSRATFVGISQVAMYDQSKTTLTAYSKDRNWDLSSNQIFIGASSFTALFYALLTMPIELARVRMSSQQGGGAKYRSMLHCISTVAKEEGVFSIYRSFGPYFGRCGSHTVTCFFIIEAMKNQIKEYL